MVLLLKLSLNHFWNKIIFQNTSVLHHWLNPFVLGHLRVTWALLLSLSGLYRWFWCMVLVDFVLIHFFKSFDWGCYFKNSLVSCSYFLEQNHIRKFQFFLPIIHIIQLLYLLSMLIIFFKYMGFCVTWTFFAKSKLS